MFGEREKPLKIRVSSHERRNELKPVWDFISISLSFRFWSAFYLCSHELRRNESQTGMDFISVMKSQTGMRFSLEQNLPESKWISADSLVTAFNAHVRLKLIAGAISLRSFWQKWNFVSVDKRSCKRYPDWNARACPCERTLDFAFYLWVWRCERRIS